MVLAGGSAQAKVGKWGGGSGNWSVVGCLELGGSERKRSERGGSARRSSWNARGLRADGGYPGILDNFCISGL